MPDHALVVGAGGAIGAALTGALRARGWRVFASRRRTAPTSAPDPDALALDLADEASVAAAMQAIAGQTPSLELIIIAAGLLHDAAMQPEKRLEDIDPQALAAAFAVNATGPLLVARHALPLLRHAGRSVFASLSARVGSISDNRTGGWYAYRASKAAQNMITRNLAHEMRNRGINTICVGLHPGTVRSALSAPFTQRLPEARLTAPATAAGNLLTVIDGLTPADAGQVFAWDGQPIPP